MLDRKIKVLSTVLISFACAKTDLPPRSSGADTQGIFSPTALWLNGTASVCFNDDYKKNASNELRLEIINILKTEINDVTKFKFTGFRWCSQGSADIRINVKDKGGAYAFIGDQRNIIQRIFRHPPSTPAEVNLYLAWDDGSKLDEVVMHDVVVHEFGHTLGLIHEQLRADSKCKDTSGGTGVPFASLNYGEYDKDSIMNYCNKELYRRRLSLSRGDVATINGMYAFSNPGEKQGQKLRCIKEDVTDCVKYDGGGACITKFCNGGEYVCSNATLLINCVQNLGGLACFSDQKGDCRG